MSLTSYGTILIKLFNILRLLLYCFAQTGENTGREECSESNFRYNKEITIRGESSYYFCLDNQDILAGLRFWSAKVEFRNFTIPKNLCLTLNATPNILTSILIIH